MKGVGEAREQAWKRPALQVHQNAPIHRRGPEQRATECNVRVRERKLGRRRVR